MLIGFTRAGEQIDWGTYKLSPVSQVEHWILTGENEAGVHTMHVATSFIPIVEEQPDPNASAVQDPPVVPPPPPEDPPEPRPPVPRESSGKEYPEGYVPPVPPTPPPAPVVESDEYETATLEPVDASLSEEHLGACEHLPPLADVGARIYHIIDKCEYRYTVHGWARQEALSLKSSALAPQPEPFAPPTQKLTPKKPAPKRKR